MIETWGRGFDKIREACAKYDGRLPEYNISASGIMVLCKACDKYLELLNDEEDLHLGQSDQDNDQVVIMRIWKNCNSLHVCSELERMRK
jgi:ATP-dependent DNA helicase RecG